MNKETFCSLPFLGLFIQTANGNKTISPCCVSSKNTEINGSNITESYNTEEYTQLRKNLFNGIKDSSCATCWKKENSGGLSIRQITNQSLEKKLGKTDFQAIIDNIVNNEFKVIEIYSLDFFPSNYCNFRCRMCSPYVSSKWAKTLNLTYKSPDFEFNESILKEIVSTGKLVKLNFTGGETILQKQVYNFIKIIDKNNLHDCLTETTIEFVTNCSIFPDQLLDDFARIFNKVCITLSIDGVEEVIENQRIDAVWETVEKNALRYLALDNKKFSIVINCVITILNINDIDRLLYWCFKNRFPDVFFTLVHGVDELDINSIDLDKKSILEKLQTIENNLDSIVVDFSRFDKKEYLNTIDNIRRIVLAHKKIQTNKDTKSFLTKQDQLINAKTNKKT